jgi:hypothetical protein
MVTPVVHNGEVVDRSIPVVALQVALCQLSGESMGKS